MTELINKLFTLLKKNNLTVCTAESCTGGLIAKSITDISGASEVFLGGVVSYANSVKEGLLGVKGETLEAFGAVSYQVAEQMAIGACEACGASVGVSTTGIAGPGGGTPTKPVGTVYVGVCIDGAVFSTRLNIDPSLSRDAIRNEAVRLAIEFIIQKSIEIAKSY